MTSLEFFLLGMFFGSWISFIFFICVYTGDDKSNKKGE